MHGSHHNLWEILIVLLFYVIGLPVAWQFVRQQGMVESSRQNGHRVVKVLAIMWPVLVFAMCINRLHSRKSQQVAEACDSKFPLKDLVDVDTVELPSATEILDSDWLQ